jgi:hypothetical protein
MILVKQSVILYLATATVFSASVLPKVFFSQTIGISSQLKQQQQLPQKKLAVVLTWELIVTMSPVVHGHPRVYVM